MRILALDQASRVTGYSIYEDGKLIDYGKFIYEDTDFGVRLNKIRKKIQSLISEFAIDELIYEDIQLQSSVGNNVDTFKKLAQVYGVVTELATELKIPHQSVYSTEWKSTVGIKGRDRAAQKKSAQDWVFTTYGIKASEDTCDAICIGQHYFNAKNIKLGAW